MKNKRGQVALFIILGIILVFGVFFIINSLKPEFIKPITNRLGFRTSGFENCLDGSLSKKIQELSLKAGVLEPKFTYMYKGENYTILCYTNEYLKPCVNQEPFLKDRFEQSLKELVKEDFEKCYENSIKDLQKRGLDVERGEISYEVFIEPKEVKVKIKAPIKLSFGETTSSKKDLTYKYKTNLYEVLMIATSLIQFETYYGDSEQMQQMLYYPNIKILKERRDDDTKVYSVIEKNEKIKFNFAVRSYPWPSAGSY
ncbi:MAG: hypothetical protein QXX68_01130 [Candidatus Pacearchaeota archaeon]